jgi:MerR family transcriptional regulator, light-induced transcriptional regulator
MPMAGKYTVNEVEDRTGVPAATLRQWERRYGFPRPERTDAGYRLYGDDDLRQIRAMKQHIDDGVPASRAAELVQTAAAAAEGPRPPTVLRHELVEALAALDEVRADRTLGEAHALHPFETVVVDIMGGAMVDLGERWHAGEITTTTEHFASNYVMGRLRSLMTLAGHNRSGHRVIVACAPHDQHEIGALMLAVMLRREGYHVYYVGADTPTEDLGAMARDLQPVAVLVSASSRESVEELRLRRAHLEGVAPIVAFGGLGINDDPKRATDLGGVFLGPTIPAAVERLGHHVRELLTRGLRA